VTARALQRVVVRLHHDPAFVAAVYADPDAALQGVDLTAAERRLLVRPDRRSWGVDPARRDRVFEAIRREYPVTCALAETAVGRPPLLGFFSSLDFHGAIQRRESVTPAFGTWIAAAARGGRLGRKPTAEAAVLEHACVSARRGRPVPSGDRWLLSPRVRIVDVATGTLDLYRVVFASLRGTSTVPRERPRLGRAVEPVVVERTPADDVTLGGLPVALATLLRRATAPVATAVLVEAAGELGVEPGEEEAVLESLVADRLLVRTL